MDQELLRPLHPLANDVLVRRETGRALESPREVVGAHVCYPSELVEGEVMDQVIPHIVNDASERALGEGTPRSIFRASLRPKEEWCLRRCIISTLVSDWA
jgi:hypothetical protein